ASRGNRYESRTWPRRARWQRREDRQQARKRWEGATAPTLRKSLRKNPRIPFRNSRELQSCFRKNPRPLRRCTALVPWESQDRLYRHERDGAYFTLRGPVPRTRFFSSGGLRAIPIACARTGGDTARSDGGAFLSSWSRYSRGDSTERNRQRTRQHRSAGERN